MRRWDALVNGYLKECERRGLAEATISTRTGELYRWGSWMKRRQPKPNLEKVSADLLVRYIKSRTAFHARTTVAAVVSTMRVMGEYLVQQGTWTKNHMRWIKGPKLDPRMRLPKRIGKMHLQRMWDAAEQSREVYSRHLLIAILSLLYATGLRRGELERLNVNSWNREEGILKIDGMKTGMERHVPVGKGVWRCLEAYLPYRQNVLERTGNLEEKALFLNRLGSRATGEKVSKMIHRLAKRAGAPLVSLHQFRHSCASDLLESGVKLPEVQKILGHAYITSTLRYTQIADPKRREAVAKHPINIFLNGHAEPPRRAS